MKKLGYRRSCNGLPAVACAMMILLSTFQSVGESWNKQTIISWKHHIRGKYIFSGSRIVCHSQLLYFCIASREHLLLKFPICRCSLIPRVKPTGTLWCSPRERNKDTPSSGAWVWAIHTTFCWRSMSSLVFMRRSGVWSFRPEWKHHHQMGHHGVDRRWLHGTLKLCLPSLRLGWWQHWRYWTKN